MTSRELNIGVVGLGYWGPNLLRALVETSGAQVRSVCDLDADRLAIFSRRYPGLIATTCFEDLLNDPELDALVLASPIHTHYALARQSLEAGKHTFVEKPLAVSTEEARALIAAA